MTNVTVLIPPAVPAGEPPININIDINNFVESCNAAISTEAKPAVLVVVDWKKLARTLSPNDNEPIVPGLLYSKSKITSVPPNNNDTVAVKTTFVCNDNEEKNVFSLKNLKFSL